MKFILTISTVTLLVLSGCDSGSPEATQTVEAPEEHMFSEEQDLIQQAQGLDSLLTEDADAKKKAVADELGTR